MSLRLKKVDTVEMRINIAIGEGKGAIRGHITGHAKVRSKDEMRELTERDWKDDGEFLRECYARLDGIEDADGNVLTGDDAFTEVCEGQFSMYLLPALCTAYVEQYGEARVGNSSRQRMR
jgi:hypothetical protein